MNLLCLAVQCSPVLLCATTETAKAMAPARAARTASTFQTASSKCTPSQTAKVAARNVSAERHKSWSRPFVFVGDVDDPSHA